MGSRMTWLERLLIDCLMVLLWFGGLAVPLRAGARDEETEVRPGFSWGAESEACSRYLWRGIPWSEGAVLQPSVLAFSGGWSFEVWANFDLRGGGAERGLNEIDLSLAYEKEWPSLAIESGLNVFVYPGPGSVSDPPTVEAVLNLSLALAGPVSVFIENALDVGAYPGGYFGEAGFRLEYQLHPALGLEASASQSFATQTFNGSYWDVSRSLFNGAFLRVALTWSFGPGFFVRSRVEEVILTAGPIREAAGRGSFFAVGLAVGVEQ